MCDLFVPWPVKWKLGLCCYKDLADFKKKEWQFDTVLSQLKWVLHVTQAWTLMLCTQ